MPRDYIARLVLDRSHRSMALVKDGVVVGGVCYRPYFKEKFAEIAFCAISAAQQVKGYGTKVSVSHLHNIYVYILYILHITNLIQFFSL